MRWGSYRANTDDGVTDDLESETTQEPSQPLAQAQATEAAPRSSDEPSDPIKARALRVARMNPVKVDENSGKSHYEDDYHAALQMHHIIKSGFND